MIFIGTISAYACVHGDDTEPKSKLNYLNGEHYKSIVNAGPVPIVLEKKVVSTQISGKAVVVCPAEIGLPLRFKSIYLKTNDGKIVQKTTCDEKGLFYFSGEFSDGLYKLQVEDSLLTGETTIHVEGYELKNVELKVCRNAK